MRFEVLGPVRIRAGADQVPVKGRRERVLLAMLLLEAGRPVPVDRLIDAIWGDGPPSTARNQVQVAVSRLRNRLREAGAPAILLTEQNGYRAQVPPDQLDLGEFRAGVTAARREADAGHASRARDHYRTALACWRGPALADVDSAPVRLAAAALDDERLHAHEERLRLDLQLGAGADLVAELTELITVHPYRERLHAALMWALYRAGRQADALAAFRRVRTLLHNELGTEPGAELQQLHRAILSGDPVLAGPGGSPRPPIVQPADSGAAPRMQVRLLGPVELCGDSGRVAVGTPRQRCVLALLAMTPGQPVALEVLADRVWGGELPVRAREALYAHVSRLRGPVRQIGAELARRGGGYVLELDPERVDLHYARRLAADARSATGTPDGDERAAQLLREASELWRGTPLAGVPGDWAARVRSGLERERLAILTERFEIELRRGRHLEMIGSLSAAQADFPLAEPLAGQLMLALYRAGRQADALEVYAQLRHRLVGEIGDEPAGWLRVLHGSILRRDHALAWPGAGEVLGAGVTQSSRPVPAQLPPDVAAFTGRSHELGQLDALLPDGCSGGTAMVIGAIEGAPGVGKTALAVHWAHRVRHRFPDGQLYADLRGFAPGPPVPPADLLARFLAALGVPRDDLPTDVDEAVAAYRSLLADRRVLVVLDNAADPRQIRPLLPGGHGSIVLVTSRERLTGLVARDGAYQVRLGVLPKEESTTLLELLLGVERARAEPVAIGELAQLCDHLPLALRVAAANLAGRPHHRIAGYVSQLRHADRLGALVVNGDADSTVPVAFELSYARLPVPARRMFRLLGLVPGRDLTTDAAGALAGIPPAEAGRLLAGLAGAHLVEEPTTGRYGCHELLRQYATERARVDESAADRAAALARLHAFYLAAADAAVREVHPVLVRLPVSAGAAPQFGDAADAQAWLDAERANLVAVITHAASHGPPPVGWRLADILRGYLALSPYLGDWQAAAQAGLAAATADGDFHALAAAHLNFAHFHLQSSSYRKAIEHATVALSPARAAGWAEGESALLTLLGNAHWSVSELRHAREHYARAHAGLERLGWKQALAALRGNLARVSVEMGRLAEAASYARQSLAELSVHAVPIAEAIALEVLGEVHHAQGEPLVATELFTRAREVSARTGYHSGEADAVHGLAAVCRDLGDRDRAVELAEAALALAREHRLRRIEAESLTLLTTLRGGSGVVDGLREVLGLARLTGDRYPEAAALIELATALRSRGQYADARASAADALAIASEVGYRLLEGAALTALAEVCLAEGRGDRAIGYAEAALLAGSETGHRPGQAYAHLVLGRVAQTRGQVDAAGDHWRTAHALFADIGMPASDDVTALLAGLRACLRRARGGAGAGPGCH